MDIDKVHPALREVVSAFLLKSKYPFKLQPRGRYVECLDEGNFNHYNEGVMFIDPNYEEENAGEIRVKRDSNDRIVFCVKGREEVSPRRKTYSDRHTKETRDTKKVLRLMLNAVVPYSLQEIARFKSKYIGQHIHAWCHEYEAKVHEPIRNLGTSYLAVVREMQNLKNLNVPLVTAEFKRVMEDTLAYHEENKYRTTTKVQKVFVTYRDDGIHTFSYDENEEEKIYANFNELPEDIRGKLAFLKMLRDNDSLSEVGLRVDEKNFWVIKMSPRVDERNV